MTNLLKVLFVISVFPFEVYADIKLNVRDDVHALYLAFVKDRNVEEITDFKGSEVSRDVVDMVIAQQALKIGGFSETFDFIPGKLNFRNTKLLEDGLLLLSFDSYWLSDAESLSDSVYITEPVIRKGEYHAGIYASTNHPSIFTIKQLNDLKNYSSVSTPKWRTDWATLSSLPIKKLYRVDEWVGMAKMVSKTWVDFFLMPFNPDGGEVFMFDNIELRHVPNIAILLNDSRHYVVSKKHPRGLEVYQALSAGLTELRAKKRIVSAYRQAGFMIDLEKFKVLNPPR